MRESVASCDYGSVLTLVDMLEDGLIVINNGIAAQSTCALCNANSISCRLDGD